MKTVKWWSATFFFLCSAAVFACSARAQEGDLTSSAGVFINPVHEKNRAPRHEARTSADEHSFTAHHDHPRPNTPHTNVTPSAESLNAKAIAAIDAKHYDDAVKSLQQAIKIKPDFENAQYNLGFALVSLGKFADAVGPLQRAAQLDAKDTDAFYYLGASLAKSGRHSEAAAAYERALLLDPKDAEVLSALGGEYAAAGDADHALDAFRRAVVVSPD